MKDYLDISLNDLMRLLAFYSAARTSLGETDPVKPLRITISDIDARSRIKVLPEEMESILYNAKLLITEKESLTTDLIPSFDEFKIITERLAQLNPDNMQQNSITGEWEVLDDSE